VAGEKDWSRRRAEERMGARSHGRVGESVRGEEQMQGAGRQCLRVLRLLSAVLGLDATRYRLTVLCFFLSLAL
jgi:hypothetical protein